MDGLRDAANAMRGRGAAAFVAGLTVEQLEELLAAADDLYYNHGSSPLSNAQYDQLAERLVELRGPRAVVGAVVPAARDKVRLPVWLGSLDKAKEDAAVGKWATGAGAFLLSDKLDGISGLLLPGGRLYTRGDGSVGENISRVLQHVRTPALRENVAVRGELVVARADEPALRRVLDYKNLRNLVAGALNSKTSNPAVLKFVRFVAYEVIGPATEPQERPSAQFARLRAWGFDVPWHQRTTELSGLQARLLARRRDSEFDVDGLVVSKDAPYARAAGRNPAYAIAFKSAAANESALTLVREVTWAVSKHNYLKPTVVVDSVELAGVTISKATGFNAKFVSDNGIGPGAQVRLVRSGDVIPYIAEVTKRSTPSLPPAGTYDWNETQVDILAKVSSAEHEVARLTYFFECLDARSVGQKTIALLYDAGYTTIREMLDARPEDVARLHGMGERSAEATCAAMAEAVARATCVSLMDASGAFGRGMGRRRLAAVYDALGSPKPGKLEAMASQPDDLLDAVIAVPGMGGVMARQYVAGLSGYLAFVKRNGLACKADKPDGAWSVVFSGFRDKEMEATVIAAGGRVGTTVTADTVVLVAKDASVDTGKVKQAREKGLPVVQRGEFDAWLRKTEAAL